MAEPEKYFSIPADGSTITLSGTVAVADFVKGVLQDGSTKYEMKDRLKPGEHIYSVHIRESGGQIVYVWPEGAEKKIAIQANDERDLLLPPFTKLYIQRAASGAVISLEASTDINAYFFSSAGLKKNLLDIQGTGFVKDTQSLVQIKEFVDELELGGHYIYGIFGPRAPPAGESLGTAYFVDGSVSSSGAGTTWATGVKTIDEGPALCTDWQNDVIFVKYVSGGYDENTNTGGVLVDVGNIHIIGIGGYEVLVENSNAGATAVFTVSVNDCEIAGFYFEESTNTVEGIYSSATYGLTIHDCIFSGNMENGIQIAGTDHSKIYNNEFVNITNDAIELSGTTRFCIIRDNTIWYPGDNGINLNGDAVDYNLIENNNINGGAGTTTTGINIALGDSNHIVGNYIGECTNLYLDTGTGNVWEGNCGTLESDWTTALDGNEQAFWGASGSEKAPLNEKGVVRFYPDLNALGVGDTVVIKFYRMNDGTNTRLVNSYTYNNVQTNLCPSFELDYSKTRKAYATIQRTAGAVASVPIGIVESCD